MRQWNLTTGLPIGEPLRYGDGAVFAVVYARQGGRLVVVAGGFAAFGSGMRRPVRITAG